MIITLVSIQIYNQHHPFIGLKGFYTVSSPLNFFIKQGGLKDKENVFKFSSPEQKEVLRKPETRIWMLMHNAIAFKGLSKKSLQMFTENIAITTKEFGCSLYEKETI